MIRVVSLCLLIGLLAGAALGSSITHGMRADRISEVRGACR